MNKPKLLVTPVSRTKKEIENARLMTEYMNYLWDEELKRINKKLMKLMKKFYQTTGEPKYLDIRKKDIRSNMKVTVKSNKIWQTK